MCVRPPPGQRQPESDGTGSSTRQRSCRQLLRRALWCAGVMAKPDVLPPTRLQTPPRPAAGAPALPRLSANSWTGLPMSSGDDDLVATTLNDTYVVERVLGEGGMGKVYQARHTRIPQKRFALKVLRPEFARDSDVLSRFQREAEAAASISHPHVMGVYDVDRTPQGWAYLVCEYLDGIDLAGHLQHVGTLSVDSAVHIAYQVCEALEAAHARGVIHRDLKPQNVFLVGDFRAGVPPRPFVKVLDFGLSKFLDRSDTQLTKTGVIMGTPAFMSPEQARGEPADHRADIYGVGAVLYSALTGRPPFDEDTPQMTVLAVMSRDPPRPRSIDPSISEHLELIIQRAMAKDPADRYPDMVALKFALEPFSPAPQMRPPTLATIPLRAASRTALEEEAAEVSSARPRLLLYIALSVLVLAVSMAVAIAGVGLLTGWLSFTPTEVALLLVAAVGTSLTPAMLLTRRIRQDVWGNSATVLTVIGRVRAPLFAALIAYGAAVLSVRFIDVVGARFTSQPLVGGVAGLGWPGWDLLLPLVGLIGAGTVLLRQSAFATGGGRLKRFLVGNLWFVGFGLVPAATIYSGLEWRSRTIGLDTPALADVGAEAEPASALGAASASPAASTRSEPTLGAIAAAGPTASSAPASDAELAAAVDQGVEGLLPLAERHPNDPAVLRALLFAFAGRATGHADAMAVAKRLFELAPDRTRDSDLQVLVTRVAETPGRASELAFELMTNHMGSAGPDLLYQLMLTKPKVAAKAERLLSVPEVRARFSPALAVAYDLRTAKSCAARVPMLDRAGALGDERSLTTLVAYSTATKRGCGRWKRKPCRARCAKEADAYRKAIQQISQRLTASGQR